MTDLHQSGVMWCILEQIAKAKKVSLAWIVRDAAERYVSDQWPLLGGQRNANL
jgi:predicted DNA-binding ribbon-helix-helix protein